MTERTGRSVEEAVESGLKALGLARAQVTVEVISEGSKGLFGLVGGKPARVRLWPRTGVIAVARRFLEDLLALLSPGATLSESYEDAAVRLEVKGRNLGALIGAKGQTLEAIQYLTNLVASREVRRDAQARREATQELPEDERGSVREGDGEVAPDGEDRLRIIVDAEGYRARRQEALEGMARRMAEKAVHEGIEIKLEPMPALERRIVHLALAAHGMVSTHSEGEEPFRRVVISPKS